MSFDPNAAAGTESGIFGLPYTEAQAKLVYLPVPWEATTSYGGGTSNGPQAILAASRQVDLFDFEVDKPYENGLHMLTERADIRAWNEEARILAMKIIEVGGDIGEDAALKKALARVNDLGAQLNELVYSETKRLFAAGKIPGLIGGDHAVPFGAIRAAAERSSAGIGILHFDAHSDTRNAYEGFQWSHASIMRNVIERIPNVRKIVQVGIRDFCEEEFQFCRAQDLRMRTFYDQELAGRRFKGEPWSTTVQEIVAALQGEIWISFDIDGLDPRFCPHTGTPVPGGLDFQQATHLIAEVVRSGRKIVGFDLNEVSPGPEGDEWDANVGARLLYKLTAWTLASQGLAKLRKQ